MHLKDMVILLLFMGPSICQASDAEATIAIMRARSACVEQLKGLGSASIIFDAPVSGASAANPAANGEMNWDAQLVTESGQIVRVQLHCATTDSATQKDRGDMGASRNIVSELVRH